MFCAPFSHCAESKTQLHCSRRPTEHELTVTWNPKRRSLKAMFLQKDAILAERRAQIWRSCKPTQVHAVLPEKSLNVSMTAQLPPATEESAQLIMEPEFLGASPQEQSHRRRTHAPRATQQQKGQRWSKRSNTSRTLFPERTHRWTSLFLDPSVSSVTEVITRSF